jgi:hypothetical protein
MASTTGLAGLDAGIALTSEDGSSASDISEEWTKHPVAVLWGEWKASSKKGKSTFDFQPHHDAFCSYLRELAAEPHCLDVFVTGRGRSCTCMHDAKLEVEAELERVVSALLKFSTKTKLDRNYIMAEWIRYADAHQEKGASLKAYLLPGGNNLICQHAIARVCGMKSYAWRGLCKKVRSGKTLEHGLSGKSSNNRNLVAREWIDEFLARLEEQGAPRATRLVRFINKEGNMVQETRDDDVDVIDLPSNLTKLGLYKQFIGERGWKYLYDPKNRVIDKVPIDGMVQDPADPSDLPSITTFLSHWDCFFPKMRIQKQAADICDDCFVFANQVRYRQRLTGKDGTGALEDELVDETIPDGAIKETEAGALASEEIILAAAAHVDKQKKQRDRFNQIKGQARRYLQKAKPLQVRTFVADFAQNMGVPNFAGEQPGKAYYLSPLNVFVFGVVDCCTDKTTLAAHTYFKTDGKKGGNNVASMLWNELTRKGLTTMGERVSEIIIVMDNCAGQNKNRMVIRLLFVLVRLKLCFRAQMLFLVKGHTKNDCDRMFNLMKQRYRKTNCYTPKELMQFVAESNEDVELVDVMKSGGFKDWDKYQNKYMKAPESIQNYHIFQVNSINPNRMLCQEAHGYPIIHDDSVVKKQFRDVTDWGPLEDELEDLPPLRVKDIKWITLYDEWRPLVPVDL